jgi:rRNA maturation endonuclease Nob1
MNQTTEKAIGITALCLGLVFGVFILKRVEMCRSCFKYFNNRGGAKGICPHCGRIIGLDSMGAV